MAKNTTTTGRRIKRSSTKLAAEMPVKAPVLDNQFLDVMQRIQRAKIYTEDWHTNIQHWRLLYDLKHYRLKGRTNEILYNDPTYTNTVDLSVGIMLGNELNWHAYGFSPSPAEQINTGKMEKLLAGIVQVNTEREETHLLYWLYQNFNRDGGGVIYSVFDPELAKDLSIVDMPSDTGDGTKALWKYSELPIRFQVVDPLKTILLPGGPKKWLLTGRVEERSVLDVETTYGVILPKFRSYSQEQKANLKGEFIDAWDYVWITKAVEDGQDMPVPPQRELAVRNTIIFDKTPILGPRIMEGYTELPYSIQFFKPTGDKSAQWHSILTPLESSIVMLERSFNRRAKQIDIYTALPMIVKTQPGRKVVIDPGLYNSVTITPDEGIDFPRWPGNAPDVELHMNMLRSRIQQSGFSDVMFGSGNNQVAGYALSQLGDQNRIRLEQPIKHLELLLTIWAKKTMKLLHYFAAGTCISVYGRRKGEDYMENVMVDDLQGYSVRAEIRPNFPNEEVRKVAMSTQVKGTLSEYTRMERYLDIEQPEDEERRKMIEAARNNPIMQQYVMISVLQEMAEAGDKAAQMALNNMQQGVPGTPGRPTEPNAPEQLQGLQSPNGQPVPEAAGELPPGQSPIDQQEALAGASPNLQGEIS